MAGVFDHLQGYFVRFSNDSRAPGYVVGSGLTSQGEFVALGGDYVSGPADSVQELLAQQGKWIDFGAEYRSGEPEF